MRPHMRHVRCRQGPEFSNELTSRPPKINPSENTRVGAVSDAMDDAKARRARLRSMREAAGGEGGTVEGLQKEEEEEGCVKKAPRRQGMAMAEVGADLWRMGSRNETHVQFRNYIPRDDTIAQERRPQAKVPEPDLPSMGAPKTSDEAVHLGAEKANWDMKRDIARKLQVLEPKTREALNDLIRQEEARRLNEVGQAD